VDYCYLGESERLRTNVAISPCTTLMSLVSLMLTTRKTCTTCIHERLDAENDIGGVAPRSPSLSPSLGRVRVRVRVAGAVPVPSHSQFLHGCRSGGHLYQRRVLGADENMDDEHGWVTARAARILIRRRYSTVLAVGFQDLLLTGEVSVFIMSDDGDLLIDVCF